MTIDELIKKIGNLQQYEPYIVAPFWRQTEDDGFADMEESTMGGWISAGDLKKILEEFLADRK